MCILQVRMTYGWQSKRRTECRNFLSKWSIPDHCKINPWKNLDLLKAVAANWSILWGNILKFQGFLTRLGSEQIGRVLKLRLILELTFVLFIIESPSFWVKISEPFPNRTIDDVGCWYHRRCWRVVEMPSVFFSSRTGDFVGHLMFDLDFQIKKKGDMVTVW